MTAPGSNSLEQRVAHVQWIAVALVALATVCVGGAVGAFTSRLQDDATSLALTRALVNELENHAADSPQRLDEEMRSELKEQATFGREIAIYLGTRLVGGADQKILIQPGSRPSGKCRSELLDRRTWRVCSSVASTGAHVHVAAPLDRLTRATQALVLALLATALGATALFGLLSRRIVRRTLKPLDELRRGVMTTQTSAAALSFAPRWGIAEVDSVAQAFDELLSRVRLAVERERRFVGDASHELRTPITRLRGQLELLLSPDAPHAKESLRAALRSCDLLTRTTESLLALAREEPSLTETVDLAEIALEVREDESQRDPSAAQRVVVEPSDEALVRGDPQLLRLAVSNLIENALKYSKGPIKVRMGTLSSADTHVDLIVEDEGPGISREEASRLIRPFARGDRARGPGTGLGLALVDHVARVHGGTLALGRGEASGLLATIRVPRWAPSARR